MTETTIAEALRYGSNFLREKGIESYSIDAQLILMHVFKLDRVQLFTRGSEILPRDKYEAYLSCINQRGLGKPLAYITNCREFMSLDFYVDETVLIPRPDTEILVEEVLKYIKEKKYKTVLDIGTGSGCIAVSLSHYIPKLNLIASDISAVALGTAKKNAITHGCEKKIAFIKSNLFNNINEGIKADVIISNPPYIETETIDTLSEGVKDYEPRLALDGGTDGLDFYVRILESAGDYLTDGGMIFFEIGYNQAEDIENLLLKHNYAEIKTVKDLSGHDRVVRGIRRKNGGCNV